MAAPITHIVFSLIIFNQYFPEKNKKEFFIGTCFADIKYLHVISREETHFKGVSLENIKKEKSSFIAGLKFHSFLDEQREKFMIKNNAYSLCQCSEEASRSLKVAEDIFFYSYIENWQEYIDFLNDVLEKETNYNIEKSKITKWHKILQKYFSQIPTIKIIEEFLLLNNFSINAIKTITLNVNQISQKNEFIKLLKKIYESFPNNL